MEQEAPMKNREDAIARALRGTLASPNESDRNGETANVVDALCRIAHWLKYLGGGDN